MCKKKAKKKKVVYIDDGHTVYDMDGLGGKRRKKDGGDPSVTRKERRAMIKAALSVYLPIILGVMACFTVVALILYLIVL